MGGLTCKGSSTEDYVVASAHMFKFIYGFDIIDFCNLYSDVHNPISFSISPVALNEDSSEIIVETQSCVKLWSSDRANDFQNNIDSSKVKAIEKRVRYFEWQCEHRSHSQRYCQWSTKKLV